MRKQTHAPLLFLLQQEPHHGVKFQSKAKVFLKSSELPHCVQHLSPECFELILHGTSLLLSVLATTLRTSDAFRGEK